MRPATVGKHAVFDAPDGERYLGRIVTIHTGNGSRRAEMRPLWQLGGEFAVDVTGVVWTHVVSEADLSFPDRP